MGREKKNVSQVEEVQQGTREAIMYRSLKLINANGMVDFRIDALANALSLSPGNITYHFSRKEDICSALWEEYLVEFQRVRTSLTALLDIKQLYLLNRVSMILAYKYRGVLIFRSSDFGVIMRGKDTNLENKRFHRLTSIRMYRLLVSNGYMIPEAKEEKHCNPAIINNYLSIRWSINFLYQLYSEEEVRAHVDEAALMGLNAIYPLLTEKGREEFKYIAEMVRAGKLLEQ